MTRSKLKLPTTAFTQARRYAESAPSPRIEKTFLHGWAACRKWYEKVGDEHASARRLRSLKSLASRYGWQKRGVDLIDWYEERLSLLEGLGLIEAPAESTDHEESPSHE